MNYYNEHDIKTAQWLQALIDQKLIPQGHVDTRSIVEVTPNDLRNYTQCHFFAGIGGWSFALQLAGIPATTRLWTGSCPCQPFSTAGKGLAQADDRHLWPVFFELVRQCRPEFVFGEQVASAIGHGWLDGISADLEAEGYACGAAVLGAHSVGAPHIRQRLYWVAHSQLQHERSTQQHEARTGDTTWLCEAGWKRVVHSCECDEDGNCPECGIDYADCGCFGPTQDGVEYEEFNGVLYGRMADSEQQGLEGQSGHGNNGSQSRRLNQDTVRPTAESGANGSRLDDARRPSDERRGEPGDVGRPPDQEQSQTREWQRCRNADSDSMQDDCGLVLSNSHGCSEGSFAATPAGYGNTAESAGFWNDSKLIPCRDGKTRRIPTEPAFFPLAHGIPARVVRLRGYGNAIVPQVAAEFIRAFYETQEDEDFC